MLVVQYFYEEQLHRMECLAQEPVLFEDVLCQAGFLTFLLARAPSLPQDGRIQCSGLPVMCILTRATTKKVWLLATWQ